MKLYHAFPRPSHSIEMGKKVIKKTDKNIEFKRGMDILKLILKNGLLCTPENFKLYPNYHTENDAKKSFLKTGDPHDQITQSRACFTLSDAIDLTKKYKVSLDNHSSTSHSESFGKFAIGLDPLEAREFGVLPTVYFYRQDILNDSIRTAGLGSQIIERLDEMRVVFSILSYVEARCNAKMKYSPEIFPDEKLLQEIGVTIKHQPEIVNLLKSLPYRRAKKIYNLFDSDRTPAWNLVDFLKIMLSLYQTSDSTIEDAPLAFFQQREWRLVHHKMTGLKWFSLGDYPIYRDYSASNYLHAKNEIKEYLNNISPKDSGYFDQCWVLAGTEELNFRDFIKEIIVPKECLQSAHELVQSFSFSKQKTPIITSLSKSWEVVNVNGVPTIKYQDNEL